MKKLIFAISSLTVFMICALSQTLPVKMNSGPGIDGVYILVSEISTLENGKGTNMIRKSPEWTEVVIFTNGVYSRTRVATDRKDDWVGEFPRNASELGYDSEVGTYELSSYQLTLSANIALAPFKYHGTSVFSYREEDGFLILTSRIPVHSKNSPSGNIVTTLRKTDVKEVRSL